MHHSLWRNIMHRHRYSKSLVNGEWYIQYCTQTHCLKAFCLGSSMFFQRLRTTLYRSPSLDSPNSFLMMTLKSVTVSVSFSDNTRSKVSTTLTWRENQSSVQWRKLKTCARAGWGVDWTALLLQCTGDGFGSLQSYKMLEGWQKYVYYISHY